MLGTEVNIVIYCNLNTDHNVLPKLDQVLLLPKPYQTVTVLRRSDIMHVGLKPSLLALPNKSRDTAVLTVQVLLCLQVGQWLTICCVS